MKVRIFSFSLFACFLVVSMLFTGTKAFSVETNEITPGQDFTPSVKPIGRLQGAWEQVITDGNEDGEQKSQFYGQRIRFGAKGKVLPNVGYLIQFDGEGIIDVKTTTETSTNSTIDPAASGVITSESNSTSKSTSNYQGKSNVDLTYAWITIGLVDKYLNGRIGLLNAPKTMEGTSSGKFLMYSMAGGLGSSNVVMGGMLYGSALNSQLHYYFWFGNAPSKWGSRSSYTGLEHYQLGLRVQYDFLRKWNHGGEWLQTKDMNGTVGISVNYVPTYDDTGVDFIEDEIYLHVNLGFTANIFYLQGGVSMAFATAPEASAANTTSEDQAHQMYLGGFVDIAITATTWLVPAIRFQYKNAGLGTGTIEGQANDPSQAETMDLLVALNLYPWSGGHRFKIQPEFQYRVMETDSKGNQKQNSDDEEYSYMAFRIGFTLNF